MSKAVADSKIDVASAVSEYALTGSVPEEVKNETVLSGLSKAFTAIIEPVLNQIGTAHIAIYGDAKTQEPTPGIPAETQTAPTEVQLATTNGLQPEEAHKYNIVVSNLKRKAEELGLLDNNFFTALQNVNLYSPSASDRALIGSEFRRVFAGNTDPLVTRWLDAINTDAQPVTSINEQNMPVTDENTPVNEDVTDTDVNYAEGEILSLKHTKNIYSVFKNAARMVVGKDVITDGFFAVPLSDEALAEVKKVYTGKIENNDNIELAKFYHADNDVVIQGNPKIDKDNMGRPEYVFKIGDKYYAAQQKYIDAVNNGKNIIKANSKQYNIPWTVHDESGNFVAIIMPIIADKQDGRATEHYESLQSVSDVKTAEQQKKADNAAKPFNQNEIRLLFKDARPYFFNANGSTYVGNNSLYAVSDTEAVEFLKTEYRNRNTNSNYEIEFSDSFGSRVEKLLSDAVTIAETGKPISHNLGDKDVSAYVISDYAIAFDKNYANFVKKHSTTTEIVSEGNLATTLLVGYDADGNATAFALPILAQGEVTAKGGTKYPFATSNSIKKTVKETKDSVTKTPETVTETPESVTNSEKTEENTPVAEEKTEYKHLYNEETVSEDFINSVNPKIENAILNIRNGNIEAVPDVVEVTELTEETIKKISDFVGFDVSGYSCKIEKDALQHIENRHGINGSHDHSLSDPKDTARMGYIVNNSDSVDWIREKDGAVKTSKKYRDKNNKPAKLVMVQKKIDGTYCVSDVVPDSKNKTIWVTSARIQKKHQDLDDNNVSPKTTPENALNASDTIIAEETENVNTSEETTTPTLTDKCELHETTHTKTGEALWVISLNDKITSDEYKALSAAVKKVGGYYSRFAKTPDGKSIPGFIFKTEPTEKEIKVFNDFFGATEEHSSTANQIAEVINAETKPDLQFGDVIELNGKQWRVTQTGFNMSFENLDKDDKEAVFSHIGGMENFKNTHDYTVISKNTSSEALNAKEKNTTETQAKNEDILKKEPDKAIIKNKGTKQIADYVASKLSNGKKLTALELSKISSEAFGGTMANNSYSIKDAYDAMELGVNKYILSLPSVSTQKMLDILDLLPTQTKRTEEMIKYQQFSTPPSIAYLANYVANINSNDVMLEPSAGIGGIAVFAKRDGATVYVNELDPRRLDIVKELPFDGFYNENAEQIDNILGGEIQPSVIVMNPPFSSSSERNIKGTKIGAKHIEQALQILAPGGRLVAIVGNGMAPDAPAFRQWWKDISAKYNVKANIGINGKNYNKYGTNFNIQMLVIDKDGRTTAPTKVGTVDTLQELESMLGGIRDERPTFDYSKLEHTTPGAVEQKATSISEAGNQRNGAVSNTSSTAGNKQPTDGAVSAREPKREVAPKTSSKPGNTSATTPTAADTTANEPGITRTREPGGSVGVQDSNGAVNGVDKQSDLQPGLQGSDGNSGNGLAPSRVSRLKHTELTDSIFEQYQTAPLLVEGAKQHPAKVSESAAMSAIEAPPITYKPSLPQKIITDGVVSDVQLESISRAGQSHAQMLPNGTRRGYFMGDGTGIGKGRTIAGIILDNYNQGRKKAVWVTLNSSLVNDAKRDVKAVFGSPDLVTQFVGGNKADQIMGQDEGILAVSYNSLSRAFDSPGSNFEKIVKWLGKDFDGVIVFDEAHKMGNSSDTKGSRGVKKASQTGLSGIAFQEALPKARIVYSSATGATEVENLRYAERLGLWGDGTAFASGDDFVSKIKAGGLAAMELVARDLKAMGVYLSRNISYDGVEYDKIEHTLTEQQEQIYNELARSWQIVLQNINKALETTNQSKDGHARGRALGAFWSSQQRFSIKY